MQFVITAYDGTDEDAPARRLKARPAHLEGAKKLEQSGNMIAGGAILNESGEMIGSTMYVEFDSREDLDHWLNDDPYVAGNVWQNIEVLPIRLAIKP